MDASNARTFEAWLASRGGGASAADLLEAGLTRTDIARLVRQGALVSHGRGRFAMPAPQLSSAWERRRRTHLHAAATASRDGVLGFRSAALAWGLPVVDVPNHPEVIREPSSCQLAGTRTVRTLLPVADVTRLGSIRITTIERTVVDISLDLPTPAALITADAALRRGANVDLMNALLRARGAVRGCRQARQTLRWADPHAESPLESQGRGEFLLGGVPRPRCNVSLILGGQEARVDNWWDELGIAAEADGRLKYAGATSRDEALWQEKLRQEWLESELGVLVLRFTHRECRLAPVGIVERWQRLAARRARDPWAPPSGLAVVQRPIRLRSPNGPFDER